jgi:predicted component of type VI protein secretion system
MKADLVLVKKDGAYKAFPLTSDVVVIGRRHDCDLQVPLPVVSRRHCRISLNGEALKIQDLGSKAGTFVNDKRVDPDGDTALKAGDSIRVGPLVFVCRIDGKPEKIAAPAKKSSAPAKSAKQAPKAAPKKAEEPDLDDDLSDLDEKPKPGVDDSFADLDASDSFVGLDQDEKDEKKK